MKQGKNSEKKKLSDVQGRVDEVETENADMANEIKLLKRLQHHQGQRLVDLESTDQINEKIRRLLEEEKWCEERIKDLNRRTINAMSDVAKYGDQEAQLET